MANIVKKNKIKGDGTMYSFLEDMKKYIVDGLNADAYFKLMAFGNDDANTKVILQQKRKFNFK